MKLLDKKTRVDATKLVIFIVVTTLATSVLVVLIGNLTFGSTRTYQAEFTDATVVVKGDDIRIAGVKVGSVKGIKIFKQTHALGPFSVLDKATATRPHVHSAAIGSPFRSGSRSQAQPTRPTA